MNTALKVFLALGGVSIILGIIAKGVKPAIKAAVKWAISANHPEVRKFVLDNRVWIETQFDAADAAVKEAVDEEAAAPAAAPPAPEQKPAP